ncbi:MAG: lipopolysaccharide biosynthesis protein [Planctomycetales bacterium]|nr:lipopolysaccharide biosynthesis protein [Planctomycetales bacterium]
MTAPSGVIVPVDPKQEDFDTASQDGEVMTDARRALASLIGQAVFAITTFVTGVVIGRCLLEEQFSLYYLAMTVVLVARNVQAELVTAPYAVFRQRRHGQDRREYAGSVVLHELALTAVGVAVVLAMLAAAQFDWVPRALTPTLLVMLAVTPFLLVRSFLRSFSFASYRFWAAAGIDLSVGVVQIGGILILWRAGILSVPAAYGVMGLACLTGILVWRWTKPEKLSFVLRRFWPDWIENWRFSRWALASQLTGTSSPYLVPWLLELYHGSSATGVYGACFTLVGLSLHFVTALANYLTPRAADAFVRYGSFALRQLLKRCAAIVVIVIGAVCVSFGVLGDWPVTFIYGAAYAGGATTCLLLALFTLAIGISVICGNGLWAVNRPECNLTADVTTMIATIGSAFWLIPWLGKEGAAAAMLIGAGGGAAVRAGVLRRVLAQLDGARHESKPGGPLRTARHS